MYMLTQEEKKYVHLVGMKDAWNLVRKLFRCNRSTRQKIFSTQEIRNVIDGCSVEEVYEKLKTYEGEIRAGDEVIWEDCKEVRWIVLNIIGEHAALFEVNKEIIRVPKKELSKTGRRADFQKFFDEVK